MEKINKVISTYFEGIKNNKKFVGPFALMRELFDPILFTSGVKEIHISKNLHNLLLEFCNNYSDITFYKISVIYGIPIIVNESFNENHLELHYDSHIKIKSINWR